MKLNGSSNDQVMKTYTSASLEKIPQLSAFSPSFVQSLATCAAVFPFKVNNYVLDNLIDWNAAEDDPIFRLVFPHPDMLPKPDFRLLQEARMRGDDAGRLGEIVARIRLKLNPHSSNQMANVPQDGAGLVQGIQHKYASTVLFFPKQGQTCHSYCSFCFRWPQFVQSDLGKFESSNRDELAGYLSRHPEVTDVVFTGGDPLVMNARRLRNYVEPLLEPRFAHIRSIRFGTKSLTYWPWRYLTAPDAAELFELFNDITSRGKQLAFMLHINHPKELEPEPVHRAVEKLRSAGAVLRSQSPILRHVNDKAETWSGLWNAQVRLGIVPYYMFVDRDTGAHDYFKVPLVRAHAIYRAAQKDVSGLARTARGPVMSADPGKVQVLGELQAGGQRALALTFLQNRNPDLIGKPFLAQWDESACWLDDLKPLPNQDKFGFAAASAPEHATLKAVENA